MLRCKECHNINILHTTYLCKGFFSSDVEVAIMEIIKNHISVPQIAAHLFPLVGRPDASAMNRLVATKFSACQQ
jgi:hypothetical protein